jgi:hypothetical protein
MSPGQLRRRALRLVTVLLACGASFSALALQTSTLPFGVKVNGIENRYPVFGVYATPGEMLRLELVDADPGKVTARFDNVFLNPTDGVLRLKMPGQPGTHVLELQQGENATPMRLNVFVMWRHDPFSSNPLNGYRMGAYPREPLNGLAVYQAPQAFVEVTPQNADLQVSPNFRLKQFVCKQSEGYPKYVVLRPELLQKLEMVLAALNEQRPEVTRFTVMSGYRTPTYNRAIGNGQYSFHVWGGAADVFVDQGGDGQMDDLNADGRIDRGDAAWLADFVDDLEHSGYFGPRLIGGIGIYAPNAQHGPFTHIDARGFRARW